MSHICFQTGESAQSSFHFMPYWGVEPDVTKAKEGSNVGQVLDRGRALSMAFSLALNAKQAISHYSTV